MLRQQVGEVEVYRIQLQRHLTYTHLPPAEETTTAILMGIPF